MKKIAGLVAAGALLLSAATVFAGRPGLVGRVSGGGEIVDGEYSISFGGNVNDLGDGGYVGQWEVNFHNVSNPVYVGNFHGNEVVEMNWYTGSGNCESAMNMKVYGKFNGEEGWWMWLRAGDNEDTVRFDLHGPSGEHYDTHSGDFTDESGCVGTARTGLDNGNLGITYMP